MSERPGGAGAACRAAGIWLDRASRVVAIAGGAVLAAVTVMSVVSIVGRALYGLGGPFARLGPIPGDFELVEMGCAFAVFSFMPWCQMRRGHVTVDIFVEWAGPRGKAWFAFVGNLLIIVAAVLIAWTLTGGMLDKRAYAEVSLVLQVPAWWGMAASLPGAWLFVVTAAYSAWRSLEEALGDGEPALLGGH